jgi:hypothetical protein
VVRRDLDGGDLEVEQVLPKTGNAEFGKAGPCFLSQVIGHLEIDVVRRHQAFACPAFVDDVGQFLGDVDAPAVGPAVLEPIDQLVAGIVLQHIDVQLALLGKAGQREVAAAQKASDGLLASCRCSK